MRISSGIARWYLVTEEGKGRLNIYFEPRNTDEYISPSECTALGVLGLLHKEFPETSGSNTVISMTALGAELVEASERVLEFFGALGLKASIQDRTLEIRDFGPPADTLLKAGLAILALDVSTRRSLSETTMNELRLSAVKCFEECADDLLRLLDGNDGEWRLKELLGTAVRREERRARDASIVSALQKLNPQSVVQFHCGTSNLLRKLFEAVGPNKTLTGVEPSIVRSERVRARLAGMCDVHHGSLLEPPPELRTDGVALIVDALPDVGDTRLERTAAILFRDLGFKWILAVENDDGEAGSATALRSEAEKFSYAGGTWAIGGVDRAVLLRRSPQCPPGSRLDSAPAIRLMQTRLLSKSIKVQREQWAATLEAFSFRTVDPRWLMYLPSAIASIQTERPDGVLEHPEDAFDYYTIQGVHRLVAETKHMGSRAIAIVCRDESAAEARFGKNEPGCVYTRNGRPFFEEPEEFLQALQHGLTQAHFWERFKTDWVCLDGEILPWSVKAERLISGNHLELLESSMALVREMEFAFPQSLREVAASKRESLSRYQRLLEKYETEIGTAVSFAPFHLIATEGRTYFGKGHDWHMRTLNALVRRAGQPFRSTRYELVDIRQEQSRARVYEWWHELSEAGDEGLVIKPLPFICRGRRGWAQPAIKCRGKEHLRMVYGPDYDNPENRLRLLDRRALSRRRQKHRRILRQFALSIEAVERFIRKEELSRVEECVRGILSLETREAFQEEQSL